MPKDRNAENAWLTEPTSFQSSPDIELWRVPKKGTLTGICISHQLTGRMIHYYMGRSGPHTGDDCDACRAGRVPREYFWIVGLQRTTNQIFLLELTDRGATPLARAWHKMRTLRGLVFEVGRTNKKENGPQRLRIVGQVDDIESLQTAPPIIPILNRIWQTAADPWKHPTPEQLRRHERETTGTPTDAINQPMGEQPTHGIQRPRGLGPTHDLHLGTRPNSSVRKSTAEGAGVANTSTPAKPIPNGRGTVADLEFGDAPEVGGGE